MNDQLTAAVDEQTTRLLADVDGLDADTELAIAQAARNAARDTYRRTLDPAQALCDAEEAAIEEIDDAERYAAVLRAHGLAGEEN